MVLDTFRCQETTWQYWGLVICQFTDIDYNSCYDSYIFISNSISPMIFFKLPIFFYIISELPMEKWTILAW